MAQPCIAPTLLKQGFLPCLLVSILYLLIYLFLSIIYILSFGNKGVLCEIRKIRFRLKYCSKGSSAPDIDLSLDSELEKWLQEHETVRRAIVWHSTNKATPTYDYDSWRWEDQVALQYFYKHIVHLGRTGLSNYPPIQPVRTNGDIGFMGYEPRDAWDYFLAYVAQSLFCEIKGQVNWSIAGLSAADLADFFSSRSLFEPVAYKKAQFIGWEKGQLTGSTPSEPGSIFQYLKSHGLIGKDHRETIEKLLEWSRGMVHYTGSTNRDNLRDFWGFDGFPPAIAVLKGTVYSGSTPGIGSGTQHFTAGCGGSTGFFKVVLRCVNIPVRVDFYCGHTYPIFNSVQAFMSHGDDPYGQIMSDWKPPIPIADILLDMKDHTRLMVPVPNSVKFYKDWKPCEHVGRGPLEAVLKHLPDDLLKRHCADLSTNTKDLSKTQVYSLFKDYNFSVADLQAAKLWARMDSKLKARGGCGKLP